MQPRHSRPLLSLGSVIRVVLCAVALPGLLAGCGKERRLLDPDQPITAPTSSTDPRLPAFHGNALQVSQGGRYFTWYGCGGCHGGDAQGPRDLADMRWRRGSGVDQVYASIAAHGKLGARIPPEQLWQLAAYVAQLPGLDPAYRRRQDADQRGEAEGATWRGPLP